MRRMTEDQLFEQPAIVEGLRYAESKRYRKFARTAFDIYEAVHGRSPDKMFQATMGQMLRLQASKNEEMKAEGTTQGSFPYLRDYSFELLTVLFPGLIANDLFNVQPAKFKNYSIFAENFKFDNNKGTTLAGSQMLGSRTKDNIDTNYTLDAEEGKEIATGNGSTAQYTVAANVLYVPLVPNTVVLVATKADGTTMTVVDNGSGALIGDVAAGTNTVNYSTGAIDVTFAANAKNATPVVLSYSYVGEGSVDNAMSASLGIDEIQGSAEMHRLQLDHTVESAFSFKQQFGKLLDPELLALAVANIKAEIDGDLIVTANNIAKVQTGLNASAGAVAWERTPSAGVQYFYWREQFIDVLSTAGNLIVDATGFGGGNKVVGGINFKQVVDTIGPRAKKIPMGQNDKGARKIAVIDDTIDCYYSPKLGPNEFFVTYKGGPLQVGLSYNPWMPLYTSEPHMLSDGKIHRYMVTGYGKVPVNRKLFVKGTLTQTV